MAPIVYVGTSGWTYGDWRGPFYPPETPKRRWLEWYGTQFLSTEINGSFYRTPSLETVRAWREQTPEGFIFAWKASKFITHWKRLSEKSAGSIELMETRLEALGPKAGPVLFQLPPNFRADGARLADFLVMLPKTYAYAFEFRNASWYADEIFSILHAHDVSLCLSDHHDAPAPWEATASHVYVRGHGPTGEYRGAYPETVLRRWAREIAAWARQGRRVYAYFDNDQKSAAPKDALRLRDMIEKAKVAAARPVTAAKPAQAPQHAPARAARR